MNLVGGKTGWPPGLLQDDSKELSRWLASRPGARYQVLLVCEEIKEAVAKRQQELQKICPAF